VSASRALAGLVVAGSLAGTPALGVAGQEVTLTVFAAASLGEPLAALATRFERDHPGARVRLNLAGSQQLAAQIEQGAPADVFASADARWMDYLRDRALVAGEPVAFASNRLALVVPLRNPGRLNVFDDLARPGLKLVLAAEAVPAGRYAREALRQRGPGFAAAVLRNVVSEEEVVTAVLAKVRLGEADAGMVYRSDLAGPGARGVTAIPVPDEVNVVARYYAAATRRGQSPGLGARFVAFLHSPEAQDVLERSGFGRADAP